MVGRTGRVLTLLMAGSLVVGGCSQAASSPAASSPAASANVVVSNVSQRAGHPIRFVEFLRYGAVVVLASMLISTAYLWVRYLD